MLLFLNTCLLLLASLHLPPVHCLPADIINFGLPIEVSCIELGFSFRADLYRRYVISSWGVGLVENETDEMAVVCLVVCAVRCFFVCLVVCSCQLLGLVEYLGQQTASQNKGNKRTFIIFGTQLGGLV